MQLNFLALFILFYSCHDDIGPDGLPRFAFVLAAEERGGRHFRRGSAEEAAGGGGIVLSSPLSIHFHPGPRSQDQRTAQRTAEKLTTGMYSQRLEKT